MKPDLALNLTPQGIALLARATGGGWVDVGEVALDDPALASALAGLRARAVELAGPGFVTKVIIPNSQILYTRLHVSGRGKAGRAAQIRTGLEGLTPYAVDDLAFDWSGKGAEVALAVVADETLSEAEDFARQHDFRPVAFVAVPEPGRFAGEPFFGSASAAGKFLPTGVHVEADAQAVRIVPGVSPLPSAAARGQGARVPAKTAPGSTRRKTPTSAAEITASRA